VFAAAVMAFIPAASAAAKTGSVFDMTRAGGYEKVTFTGDSAAGCESYGVCGYSGTVTYTIGGTPKGTIVIARSRSGKLTGGASYRTNGVTRTTVTPPAPAPPCTETSSHRDDVFSLNSTGSGFQSLLLSYHSGGGTYLDSGCSSLYESDLAAAGVLPQGGFRAADFHGPRLGFSFSGGSPFHARGYSATVEWKLAFKGRARACNPSCRIPVHRPR
jgi:hypothetical protein